MVTGFSGASAFRAVATGDFNEDGLRDLAALGQSANQIRVLLGTGGGFFAAPIVLGTGAVPSSVGVADFNADGNDDLVTALISPNDLQFFLGDGARPDPGDHRG